MSITHIFKIAKWQQSFITLSPNALLNNPDHLYVFHLVLEWMRVILGSAKPANPNIGVPTSFHIKTDKGCIFPRPSNTVFQSRSRSVGPQSISTKFPNQKIASDPFYIDWKRVTPTQSRHLRSILAANFRWSHQPWMTTHEIKSNMCAKRNRFWLMTDLYLRESKKKN